MAAAENKEQIVTVSLLLYVAAYLLVGLTGFSFPIQPAAAVYNAPFTFNNPNPSGGEAVNNRDVTLSVEIIDEQDGDDITATFYCDGSDTGTDTISSGGTATQTCENRRDGDHTWYVEACDTDGNCNTAGTWSFTVNGPPTVSASTNSPTSDTREEVTYTAEDGNLQSCSASGGQVSWSCTTNSDGGNQYSGTCTPQGDMDDGTRTVTVTCTDSAGNTGSDSVDLTVDTTPPTIQCVACDTPDPVRAGNDIRFSPDVDDPVTSVAEVDICQDSTCSDTYCDYSAPADACSYETLSFTYSVNDYWIRAEDEVGNAKIVGPPDRAYRFTAKKWAGQTCTADRECLIGSCTDGTCQIDLIPAPSITLR